MVPFIAGLSAGAFVVAARLANRLFALVAIAVVVVVAW